MYVWAMRDKGSEWRALHSFGNGGPLPFSPIIEAVSEVFVADGRRVPQHPEMVVKKLSTNIKKMPPAARTWVDLGHLLQVFTPHDVAEIARMLRQELGARAKAIVPVIRTSTPPSLASALLAWGIDSGQGVGIRVDGLVATETQAAKTSDLVTASGVPATAIDLIIDAQDLPRTMSHEELADVFPASQTSRNYILLGGTFPGSITPMRPDDYQHFRERGEWSAWQEEMLESGAWRHPNFGDFATQPSVYSPSPSFPGSPSIRYTIGDQFVVLRGRGGNGMDFNQYIGHARFIQQQPYFREVVGTRGDAYIERIATGTQGPGNMTTWRVASFQRHLAVAVAQVERFATVLR